MLKADVIGYIGNDATVKLINDTEYVSFNVAHNEVTKNDAGEKTDAKTVWLSVLIRGNGGALLPYLKKGQQVFVRGDFSPRIYTDNEGNAKVGLTLFGKEINLCGGGKEQASEASSTQQATQGKPESDTEMPF